MINANFSHAMRSVSLRKKTTQSLAAFGPSIDMETDEVELLPVKNLVARQSEAVFAMKMFDEARDPCESSKGHEPFAAVVAQLRAPLAHDLR